ncbi:TPA: FTR1 family protein [Neisseria gonorrhoeae]|uniref:FTR1 family iron permease n=1 Tax=Neisseria gonorrhoeae TaxID=485 RepID=UPI00390536FB
MPKVWFGVVLASLMCLGIGYGIHSATGEIPRKQQEFVVGIIGLVAVAMLTCVVLWMKKAARSMKRQLRDSVQAALNRGSGQGWPWSVWRFLPWRAKVWRAFFFLLAVFKQSPTWQMPAGAVAGVLAAAVIGALIYQGGMRLNLAKFFRWTGAFLIIVAAGLLAGSLRALHEAGIWNALQDIVLDPSKYLHEDSPLGVLLGGFFGYTDHPAQGGALVWLLYLIPVMIWFLRGSRPSETLTRKEELK